MLTGAEITGLSPTYAGQRVFCTSTGSGYTAGTFYSRNNANNAWVIDRSAFQRASGEVSIGTTEVDIVSVTPTYLPCHIIVFAKATMTETCTVTLKVTDGNNTILTEGSAIRLSTLTFAQNSLTINNYITNSGSSFGIFIAVVPAGTTTPIKVRGVSTVAASGTGTAEIEVVS